MQMSFKFMILFVGFMVFPAFQVRGEMPEAPTKADARETEEFDFAGGLLSRGMYDMAVSAYRDYLKKYPEGYFAEKAKFRIGESFFLAGEREKAQSSFEDLLTENPGSEYAADALIRKGQIFHAREDLDAARENFVLAKKHPVAGKGAVETAEYYLALMLYEAGDLSSASLAFRKFLEKYEKGTYSVFAGMHLGEVLIAQGEPSKAAEMFDVSARLAEEDSLRIENLLRSGEAHSLAGRKDSAIEIFSHVLKIASEQSFSDRAAAGIITAMYRANEPEELVLRAAEILPLIKGEETLCRANFLVANSYLRVGEYVSAGKIYDEIRDKCTTPLIVDRAELNSCWALFNLGEYEKCLDRIKAYTEERDRDIDEAYYLQARSFSALGKWQQAKDVYSRLLEQFPHTDLRREVLYDKGWAHYNLQEMIEGAGVHRLFVKEFSDDERSAEMLLKVAQVYLEDEQYHEAAGFYELYAEEYPGHKEKDFALYQKARAYYGAGEMKRALEIFDKVIDITRDPALRGPSLYWKARIYQEREQWDLALENFELSVAEGGDTAVRSAEAAAFTYFKKGDEMSAAEAYYSVIRSLASDAPPLHRDIYLWAADIYTTERENEKALALLTAAQEAYPENVCSETLFMFGENYRMKGHNEEALRYYSKAIEKGLPSPRKERGYLGSGRAYAALGDNVRALETLEKALAAGGDNITGALARMEMGDLHAAENDYFEAARKYSMVAILYDDPDITPEALFRAGTAFTRAGSGKEGEEMFRELLERFPTSERSSQIKERILREHEQ